MQPMESRLPRPAPRLNTASDQQVQVQRDTSTLDAEAPV